MSVSKSLTKVFNASKIINYNDKSKFIFLSDCHRGDNSSADNFAPNRHIYMSALDYYYDKGFTYIEIGDGDELWENDKFSDLIKAHTDIYLKMSKFHKEGRFYMIWGNHDIYKCNHKYVQKNLYEYYNPKTGQLEPLFDNLQAYEGLILKHESTGHKIFVVHGHQGDLLNDTLWPVARFLVRYVWRHIEILKYNNPLSPSRNIIRLYKIENELMNWAEDNNQIIICGHTHRSAYAIPGKTPYFNDGCCCRKGYITGIEIENNEISLIRWSRGYSAKSMRKVEREVISGPINIESFLINK